MTITFKIKETIAKLIAGCEAYEHYDFIKLSDDSLKKGWIISDQDFDSTALVELMEDGSIKIETAMSGFIYHIMDLPTGGAQVVYEGAYRGLLEQFLLPKMTPKFSAIDTVRTSAGKYMTLACYQAEKGGHYRIKYEGIIPDYKRFQDMPVQEIIDKGLYYSYGPYSDSEVRIKMKDGSLMIRDGVYEELRTIKRKKSSAIQE